MDEKVKEAIFKKVEHEPFAQKFGIKLLELDEGYSKVEVEFAPDMENFLGMAHGGALFALIDEAFETASNSHGTIPPLSPPGERDRVRGTPFNEI
jgi:acyl-CoA thioesterase